MSLPCPYRQPEAMLLESIRNGTHGMTLYKEHPYACDQMGDCYYRRSSSCDNSSKNQDFGNQDFSPSALRGKRKTFLKDTVKMNLNKHKVFLTSLFLYIFVI